MYLLSILARLRRLEKAIGENASIEEIQNQINQINNSLGNIDVDIQNLSGYYQQIEQIVTNIQNSLSNYVTQATVNNLIDAAFYTPKYIWVDPINGNNSTAQKYYRNKPYKNYSGYPGALTNSSPGDIIVCMPGEVTGSTFPLKNNVDVHLEKGCVIKGTIIDYALNSTGCVSNVTGNGVVNCTLTNCIHLKGVPNTNVSIKLDGIIGGTYGLHIEHFANADVSCNLECNYIIAYSPIRVQSGKVNLNVKIKDFIKGTGDRSIMFAGDYTNNLTTGNVYIESPYLENNSATAIRSAIYFGAHLNNNPGYVSGDLKISINIDKIFMSSDAVSDATISGGVWLDGGDNIYVRANIIAKKCFGVCNRGGGGAYFGNGNVVFEGVFTSEKEIVSSGAKYANGNGWNNLIFRNSVLKTKGLGASASVAETGVLGGWNGVHGGVMGITYFENCKLINEYADSDKSVFIIADRINSPAQDINHFNFFNCLAEIKGGDVDSYFVAASGTYSPNKVVGVHCTRSNKGYEPATVSDLFHVAGGLLVDPALTINSF